MQLLGKLVIKSKDKIIQFLNQEHTGRISSIDDEGYPQIIPMNFIFINYKRFFFHISTFIISILVLFK